MKNDVQSLWLAGGTALLVTPQAPSREYVLDSVWYAQLVADKHRHSRFDDYARWYSAYRSALENCGWIVATNKAEYLRESPPSPLTFLAERLKTQHPQLAQAIDAALCRLAANDARQHLQQFTQNTAGAAAGGVHELGIVLAGPTLVLSSLASGEGAELRDSVSTLDELVPVSRPSSLHLRLKETGNAASITDLGVVKTRACHEQP